MSLITSSKVSYNDITSRETESMFLTKDEQNNYSSWNDILKRKLNLKINSNKQKYLNELEEELNRVNQRNNALEADSINMTSMLEEVNKKTDAARQINALLKERLKEMKQHRMEVQKNALMLKDKLSESGQSIEKLSRHNECLIKEIKKDSQTKEMHMQHIEMLRNNIVEKQDELKLKKSKVDQNMWKLIQRNSKITSLKSRRNFSRNHMMNLNDVNRSDEESLRNIQASWYMQFCGGQKKSKMTNLDL